MSSESSLDADFPDLGRRRKPGPKPGTRHAGMFQPGQSGNPSGRPQKTERQRTFEEICRQKSLEALDVLEQAVYDETAPWKDRLHAFSLLSENGHGRPIDRLAVKTMNEGGANVEESNREVIGRQVNALLGRIDVVSEQ